MKRLVLLCSFVTVLAIVAPTQAQEAPAVSAATASQPAAAPTPAVPYIPAVEAPVAPPVAVVPAYQKAWWQELLAQLVLLAGTVVLALLGGLVSVLKKKYGIETDTKKLEDAAAFGLGWVEQKVVKAAKLDGKPTPAAEAIEKAVDLAMDYAREQGAPEKARAWWERYLESKLGLKKK